MLVFQTLREAIPSRMGEPAGSIQEGGRGVDSEGRRDGMCHLISIEGLVGDHKNKSVCGLGGRTKGSPYLDAFGVL